MELQYRVYYKVPCIFQNTYFKIIGLNAYNLGIQKCRYQVGYTYIYRKPFMLAVS